MTDRRLEIFRLIGKAVPTRAIAERLFVSVHTIETHRQNIKKKLGIRNASELSQRDVQWELENSRQLHVVKISIITGKTPGVFHSE